METALWSLAVSLVGALAFLAYRHPDAYRQKLLPQLVGALVIGVSLVVAYGLGRLGVIAESFTEVAKALPSESIRLSAAAESLVEIHKLMTSAIAGAFVCGLYLTLLTLLPKLGLVSPAFAAVEKPGGDQP